MHQIQQNGEGFRYVLEIQREGFENQVQPIPIHDWRTFEYEHPAGGQVYEPYLITLRARNTVGFARQDPSRIRGFTGEDSKFQLVCFLSDSFIIIS